MCTASLHLSNLGHPSRAHNWAPDCLRCRPRSRLTTSWRHPRPSLPHRQTRTSAACHTTRTSAPLEMSSVIDTNRDPSDKAHGPASTAPSTTFRASRASLLLIAWLLRKTTTTTPVASWTHPLLAWRTDVPTVVRSCALSQATSELDCSGSTIPCFPRLCFQRMSFIQAMR